MTLGDQWIRREHLDVRVQNNHNSERQPKTCNPATLFVSHGHKYISAESLPTKQHERNIHPIIRPYQRVRFKNHLRLQNFKCHNEQYLPLSLCNTFVGMYTGKFYLILHPHINLISKMSWGAWVAQ